MDDYKIELIDGCAVIYGAIPIDVMLKTSKMFKNGIMAIHEARLAGANLVMGQPGDVRALRDRFEKIRLEDPDVLGISAPANRWLKIGQQGNSSCTLFFHTVGINPKGHDKNRISHPLDGDDFSRCHYLFYNVPEVKQNFYKMENVSPIWNNIYNNWETLSNCYVNDKKAFNNLLNSLI